MMKGGTYLISTGATATFWHLIILNLLQWLRSDKSQDFFNIMLQLIRLITMIPCSEMTQNQAYFTCALPNHIFDIWHTVIHTPSPKKIQQQEIRCPTVIFALARCIQAYQVERKACSWTSGQRKRKLGNQWTERLPWWWFTTFLAFLPWRDDPIWRAYSFQLGLKLPSR